MPLALVSRSVLVLTVLAAAAVPAAGQQGNTSAQALPSLPAATYHQIDGSAVNPTEHWLVKTLSQFIPGGQATRALSVMGGAAECVQKEDIAAFRLYFQRGDPWAAGLVTVISKANVRSPSLWMTCAKRVVLGSGPGEPFAPCAGSVQDPQFWYFYGATKPSVCADVRAVLLQSPLRSEGGGPPPAETASSTVTVRPPIGAPAVVSCSAVSQMTQYGPQQVNVVTVHGPEIVGASGRVLPGTYAATLLQGTTGGWTATTWRPTQQGSNLVFAGMPPGQYAMRLQLQFTDEAGRQMQSQVDIALYATPLGPSKAGCIF